MCSCYPFDVGCLTMLSCFQSPASVASMSHSSGTGCARFCITEAWIWSLAVCEIWLPRAEDFPWQGYYIFSCTLHWHSWTFISITSLCIYFWNTELTKFSLFFKSTCGSLNNSMNSKWNSNHPSGCRWVISLLVLDYNCIDHHINFEEWVRPMWIAQNSLISSDLES